MTMKNIAVIVAIVCSLDSPALADSADVAAVLRDLGRSIAQDTRPSVANALTIARAQQRSTRVCGQHPGPVIVVSPSAIDLNLFGHN
jgi:hypothetical protein